MAETETQPIYELTLLMSGALSDFDVNKTLDTVRASIKAKGGLTLKDYSWGKRKLAYPINQAEFGHYHTLIITAPPTVIAELTHELELSNDVVRHLLISLAKEKVEMEELFTPEKEEAVLSSTVAQKIATAEAPKPRRTPTTTVSDPATAETTVAPEPTPKPTPADNKARQKDLDEKLDQLLNTELE